MNNNRRKRVKRTAACSLAIAVMVTTSTVPCLASAASVSKEENVYATLEHDGEVKGIYVVNGYDLSSKTDLVDYGTYTSVKNLTTDAAITTKNETVSVTAEEGKFYYQGDLSSKDMPWTVSIQYLLDGTEIAPKDLGGQSGHLKIKISVTENQAVSSTFFEHYLLQVSLSLDTKICEGIKADGATIANVGSEKQILYNIMPGNEKEMEIEADVKEFTMSQISFKGVESSFGIDSSSIDISEITKETSKITDAAKKLNEAAGKVADGTDSLHSGSKKIKEALTTLNSNGKTLTDGSNQVLSALTTLNAELEKVSVSSESLSTLTEASASVKSGISAISAGIAKADAALSYSTMNQSIWNALSSKNSQATAANKEKLAQAITSNEVQEMLATLPDGEMKRTLVSYVTAAQTYVAIDEAYQKGLESYLAAVKGSKEGKAGTAYLAASANVLAENYAEFDAQIQKLEGSLSGLAGKMDVLKDSINTLMKQYATLDSGLTSYADGVSKVLDGYSELENGITALQDGTGELKKGTTTFVKETSGIDELVEDKIDTMIDQMTGSDFEKVSFVSEKNSNVEAIQFVMVTEEITKPEEIKQEAPKETKTFWEKLKDLFL